MARATGICIANLYNYRGATLVLVRPNVTLRNIQLNEWTADNFTTVDILFSISYTTML